MGLLLKLFRNMVISSIYKVRTIIIFLRKPEKWLKPDFRETSLQAAVELSMESHY